jgi:chorismate synthase
MLKFMTAGESHGRCLVAILDGIPAGLKLSESDINRDLARRMIGYGRGPRMRIEKDKVQILSGIKQNETIGSPIALLIPNTDNSFLKSLEPLTLPRPGHADLAGSQKYDRSDLRDILERASARETASRTAAGAICKVFLQSIGINVVSWVQAIGKIHISRDIKLTEQVIRKIEKSQLRIPDGTIEKQMKQEIDHVSRNGDTIGGVFVVSARNVPPGIGSHVMWDKRLDGRLAQGLMSIPAVKGVAAGAGFALSATLGSKAHDEIVRGGCFGFKRISNNAGGIEGGISNGEEIRLRCVVKPVSTLSRPLKSVDIRTHKPGMASVVRSDVCVVPAAGIVGEAMVSFVLADAILEKFGGDSMREFLYNYRGYIARLR